MSASGVLASYSTLAVTIPLISGLEMPEHEGGAPESVRGSKGLEVGCRLEP